MSKKIVEQQKTFGSVSMEIADQYQDFFNMMSQEHGLILTISEMDDIISEALKIR